MLNGPAPPARALRGSITSFRPAHVRLDFLEREHAVAIGVGEVELAKASVEELIERQLAVALSIGGVELLRGQALDVRQHQVALPVFVEEVEQVDRPAMELFAIDLA